MSSLWVVELYQPSSDAWAPLPYIAPSEKEGKEYLDIQRRRLAHDIPAEDIRLREYRRVDTDDDEAAHQTPKQGDGE